jgi:hypothetical protein
MQMPECEHLNPHLFNVVPTDQDIYNPRSWLKDALLRPESRKCYQRLLAQGWTDSVRARYPDERIYTFWDYFRQHWQKDSGLRIDHLLLSADLAPSLRKCRRRSLGPRPAPCKRPRADLDRAGYGREEENSPTEAQHGQAKLNRVCGRQIAIDLRTLASTA